MELDNLRITKLREYLLTVLNKINKKTKQINANMLSSKIDNYSLDKIPVKTEVEKWILGDVVHRDVFSFRSRMAYSQDTINNLKNIGFFEQFERIIKSNNDEGILPEIEGIEGIECLNCGTMKNNETNTSEFDIQIQITYREVGDNGQVSC